MQFLTLIELDKANPSELQSKFAGETFPDLGVGSFFHFFYQDTHNEGNNDVISDDKTQ